MATLYAWSQIQCGKNNGTENDPKFERVNVKPGETVTQEKLGLNDEQWKQMLEGGSVRAMAYPDMPETYQDSPVQFFREQARKAAEGALMDAETSEANMQALRAENAASTGTEEMTEDKPTPEKEKVNT